MPLNYNGFLYEPKSGMNDKLRHNPVYSRFFTHYSLIDVSMSPPEKVEYANLQGHPRDPNGIRT